MPDIKLRELINTFTEQELDLVVPIDVQDVDADHYNLVNTYNSYLSTGDFASALKFRTENTALDKYIFDAKKMNMLQAMIINAYLFAKDEKAAKYTSYDNSSTGLDADNVQEAIDEFFTEQTNKISDINKKIPTNAQDLNIAGCTVTGAAGATTILKDNEKTELPLSETMTEFGRSSYLYAEDNGIRVHEYGLYLISASAYISSDKVNGNVSKGIFVNLDNGKESREILSSTEHVYDNSSGTMGAITTATKLIRITQDDMDQYNGSSAKISVSTRVKGTSGTVYNSNCSTFLTVLRIADWN